MDQVLVSVCCPPQNEHYQMLSKKLQPASSYVGVNLKRCRKCQKIRVILLLHLSTFFVQGVFQELLWIQA